MNPVFGTNVIVAVGSVDGIAGASAVIRHSGNPNIKVVFTQAFQVNTINMSDWPKNSKVGIVDLGVNNEGQTPNPKITEDFVTKIYELGHSILFIADEHGKKPWFDVFEKTKIDPSSLTILPENRDEFGPEGSSSAILKRALNHLADEHTTNLLQAGHDGDQMKFDSVLGKIINNSIKSNLQDNSRRVYLAHHLAINSKPDDKILGWMNEYSTMLINHDTIIASRVSVGKNVSLYNAVGLQHDGTVVFNRAYSIDPVAILRSSQGVSIATNNRNFNVLATIQSGGIPAGGFPAKATLTNKDDEKRATEVVVAAYAKL